MDVLHSALVFASGPDREIFLSVELAARKYCLYRPTMALSRLCRVFLTTSTAGCSTPTLSSNFRNKFRDIATPEMLLLVLGSV